ncbi:MAG TPA: hypothetical protein VEK56_11600, partial [Vicinamibacterales bacterium]|nr:hypothetical protein [Vicinamibacterales bacterium]
SVTLSWTSVGVQDAVEYVLEAGSASGLSDLYNASVGSSTSLSASIGTGTYYVRVRARRVGGAATAPSNEISFSVGATGAGCAAAPAAPSDLSGSVAGDLATLAWSPSTGASSYLVQAGSAPGLSDVFYGNVGGAASVDGQVSAGFSAYVRVIAVNACGQSAASTELLLH